MAQENMVMENIQHENMAEDDTEQENNEQYKMEEEIIEEENDDPTLKFIEAVKEHKSIWDMQSEEYYNRRIYRAAWRSLLPSSEGSLPRHPNSKQRVEIKNKVAELQKVWVELRDTYYKNEDPGKKYKDSLRFLHSVYQSREMEAVLEFDEPSWDLMDIRTWTVKKSHIPKKERITNPAPEYELKRLRKRKCNIDGSLTSKKLKASDKQKATGEENAPEKDLASDKENKTAKANVTEKNLAIGKENSIKEEMAFNKENIAGKENAIEEEMATDKENTTEKATDNKNTTYKENRIDKECLTGKENATNNKNAADEENAPVKENASGKGNMPDKEYETVKENAPDNEIATDNENAVDEVNADDEALLLFLKSVKTVVEKDNATPSTSKENPTDEIKAPAKTLFKPNENQLSILEKAMRLHELENPGVWSSEDEEPDKSSRLYVENTSQTDETGEFPNMPINVEWWLDMGKS